MRLQTVKTVGQYLEMRVQMRKEVGADHEQLGKLQNSDGQSVLGFLIQICYGGGDE